MEILAFTMRINASVIGVIGFVQLVNYDERSKEIHVIAKGELHAVARDSETVSFGNFASIW